MKVRLLAAIAACLVCLVATSPAQGQGGLAVEISGFVRAADTNSSVPGTVISLRSDAGEMIQQATPEGNGHFVFQVSRRGVYYVTAVAPGYREVSERADAFSIPRVSVFLFLTPANRSSQHQSPPPGGFVNQHELLVSPGAQKEFEKGRKLFLEDKEPEKSIPHFRKAIQMYPSYAAAYVFLGMANMDLHRWKDAESALGKAIGLDDKLAAAYLTLGACENLQGNFAAAEKPLLRVLELSPEAADGHFELGKTYWALGRWQEAEPHARKVITSRPEFPPGHLLMGNILLRKREAPAALSEFKEYLRLEPNGEFAAPTRDLVARIEQALATAR